MYFRTLVLSGCAVLVGCQSAEPIEQVQTTQTKQVNSIAALQSIKMTLPSRVKVDVTPQSQSLKLDGINGPVAVFELPTNRGEFSLTITSFIKETAFVPRAVVFDREGREIERYGAEMFQYKKPRFHLGNRLMAEIDFFPPVDLDMAYLVIYADKEQLNGSTFVIHPARLDAQGRGNYLPEMKDIALRNSPYGQIEVAMDRSALFNQTNSADSSAAILKPEDANIRQAPQLQTQHYYHTAIKAAVESNDLNKAIGLLDEAKTLGVSGAQEVFIKAVNSNH
ncbi:MalM family protein [Vibrio ostreicida]|uniref:MalM family protein n=1 Tax=Vibrio ostreicida TaxID=526588 RepID=UPI003B5CB020